jgi:hypothetical protein
LSDLLQEAIDTLTELKRLHQLNFELIEHLNIACQYIVDKQIKVPNESYLRSLVAKALALIAEIQADTPKTLIYKKLPTIFHNKDRPTETSQNLYYAFIVPHELTI